MADAAAESSTHAARSAHVAGSEQSDSPAATPTSNPRSLLPTATLPKGGGAIKGIDETFATNPATGTGSLTVPIATSPGRGGFGVPLQLTYDSGTGNGPFGIGWTLSLPSITRRTDKGLPTYRDDDSDTFLLTGSDDLVPVGLHGASDKVDRDGHRVRRYRPRSEGSFARIERWTRTTDGDVHWRVTDRNNVTSIYGRDPSARIVDPAAPDVGRDARVFSWLLEDTRDDRGNVAIYEYAQEDGAGVTPQHAATHDESAVVPSSVERARFAHDERGRLVRDDRGAPVFEARAQRYIKRIRYGNRAPVGPRDDAPRDDDAWPDRRWSRPATMRRTGRTTRPRHRPRRRSTWRRSSYVISPRWRNTARGPDELSPTDEPQAMVAHALLDQGEDE